MISRFGRLLSTALSVSILLSGISCGLVKPGRAWQMPRPVAIHGGDMWINMAPSGITWITAASGNEAGGMLLRDGDMLLGDDAFLMYRSEDGASLDTRSEYGRMLLSGKTVGLYDEEGFEWLEQASLKELKSLRSLAIPNPLEESVLPVIKKLAAANPSVAVIIDVESVPALASLGFKPRMVYLMNNDPDADMGALLADQKQIETLYIPANEVESLDFLAGLPNLRRLSIDGWDPDKTGPLPPGMRALESLVISSSYMRDASVLANVANELEELSILMCDEFADPAGLARFSGLRTLILNLSPGITDLSELRRMKELSWAGLPPETTQDQFLSFVGEHPDLKILEMVNCENIADIQPLQKLSGLTGLVLCGYEGSFDALGGMKSLTFLGLPGDAFENSPDTIAEIRRKLPDALVVPTNPMCLGSGWILLVFPIAALMWLWRRRRGIAP